MTLPGAPLEVQSRTGEIARQCSRPQARNWGWQLRAGQLDRRLPRSANGSVRAGVRYIRDVTASTRTAGVLSLRSGVGTRQPKQLVWAAVSGRRELSRSIVAKPIAGLVAPRRRKRSSRRSRSRRICDASQSRICIGERLRRRPCQPPRRPLFVALRAAWRHGPEEPGLAQPTGVSHRVTTELRYLQPRSVSRLGSGRAVAQSVARPSSRWGSDAGASGGALGFAC